MALKSALLEILSCMLSNSSEIRNLAEERRKALEVTDEYSLLLLDIIVQEEEAPEERKLATVLLKQFIEANWKSTCMPIILKEEVKVMIRNTLPTALNCPIGSIQNIVAQTLFIIISQEPDYWSVMSSLVLQKLKSSNFNEVYGSLRFLQEVTTYDYEHLFDIPSSFYDILYDISGGEHYTVNVRCLALKIFTVMLNMYFTKRRSTEEIINRIYTLYVNILTKPGIFVHNDFRVETSAIDSLTFLSISPHVFVAMVPKVLPVIWEIMMKTSEEYIHQIYGDGTEVTSSRAMAGLIKSIFLLLKTVIIDEMPHAISEDGLCSIFHYIIIFLMVTPELEMLWQNSVELYFNFDNDCSDECALRFAAKLLFDNVIYKYNSSTYIPAFSVAVTRVLETCIPFSNYWWRINDSIMFCLGMISKRINEVFKASKTQHYTFLRGILFGWMSCIDTCPNYIFLSRILWIGGRYMNMLNPTQVKKLLYECLNALRSDHPVLLISGLKAIYCHSRNTTALKTFPDYDNLLRSILENVYKVAQHLDNDYFHIAIKIYISFLEQEPNNQALTNKNFGAVSFLIEGFHRLGLHYKISSQYLTLLKTICNNSICFDDLKERFLPDILNIIMGRSCTCLFYRPNDFIMKYSLQLLDVLITVSPLPLTSEFVRRGFLATCQCILNMNDNEINQSGAAVLCSYLTLASNQFHFDEDSDEYRLFAKSILDVILSSLCPQYLGLCSFKIGWLFVTSMEVFGKELNGDIDRILRVVLSRIQRLNENVLEEATLIILAYLFLKHTTNVVNFLLIIPGPDGCSALGYVLDKWLAENRSYRTLFERNLSVMAIATFLKYAAVSKDRRITEIYIKSNDTPMPVLAQGYLFIVDKLKTITFNNEQVLNQNEDSDTSSGISSFSSSEYSNEGIKKDFSSNHPITTIDLKEYIMEFLHDFSNVDYFNNILQFFTDSAAKTYLDYLVNIGIIHSN